MGLTQPLFAQQDIIKEYADSTSSKNYCLYPSTLRMLNFAKNQDYFDMVKDIEKILIYSLNTTAKKNKSYINMLSMYKERNFEEYAAITGGKTNFYLYGKASKQNQFVGVYQNQEEVYVFFLIGNIAFQKIPSLIQTLGNSDMLNLFDITPNDAR